MSARPWRITGRAMPEELKANLPTVEAEFGRQGADNYNNNNAEDV